MISGVISIGMNNLGSSLSGDCKMEFVLHHGIEFMGDRIILIIVNAAFRKNISDLLPDSAFACTNRTNPLQQFSEVVLAESGFALLQTFIVQDKTFDHVLFQNTGCPNTEMCCPTGIDTVSYRNDCIQIIETHTPGNFSTAFLLNYRDFLGSCDFRQLTFGEYVLKMQRDIVSGASK